MKKIDVINNVTGKSYSATFDTAEEAEAWKSKCIQKNSWGKPEREVLDDPGQPLSQSEKNSALSSRQETEEIPASSYTDENGNEIITEAYTITRTYYTLPCEYIITEEDSTNGYFSSDEAFDKLRSERNKLLAETDFTQLPDAPVSSDERVKYKDYRTYLRFLPGAYTESNIYTYTILSFEDWKLANP